MVNLLRLIIWCAVSLPWLVALYMHFWLVQNADWSPEHPYRGLMSLLLLALGMLMSFLLHGRLKAKRDS